MRTGKKILVGVLSVVGVLAVVAVGVGGWYVWRNVTWNSRLDERVARAGFIQKETTVDGVKITYGENSGGEDKPALLLIHGQGSEWRSYHKVLGDLGKHFHVYAVDVPGHGGSDRMPGHYTAPEMAEVVSAFAAQVIGGPAYVSGHSSGGLIAASFAAAHPEQVKGVLFEDPPFFATELPRAKETWNWQDLATSAHNFNTEGETDWPAYYWQHQRMWMFFGDGAKNIINDGLKYHAKHPDQPINVFYMPGVMAEMARWSMTYDPHFGEAFYDGTWNNGVDLDATLGAIQAPITYVHTKEVIGEDGILQAAASNEEAARAIQAMPGAEFVEADTGHNFHGEAPAQFVELMLALAQK
ncbi:alpha/beta hydrolase [Corynebacterium sp. S7]